MNIWKSITQKNSLETIYDKSVFVALLLVIVTYPFSMSINSLTIILLAGASIIKLIVERKIYLHKVYILFFLIFLIRLLSLFYTTNMHSGGRAIERSLSLLIFPLVFMVNKPILLNRTFLFKTLNIATLVACLFCLLNNYYYFVTNNISVKWWLDWKYNNHHLSSYLDFGPNYFSLVIVINLAGMYFYKYNSFRSKILWSISYCIQFIFLLLLSSRSLILFFVLSTTIIFLYKMYNKYKIKGIIMTTVFLVFGTLVALSIPVVKQRFNKTYLELVSDNKAETKVGGFVNRIQKVKSAIHILKENYLLGVGIGDVKDELKKEYIKIDFQEGINLSFDAHNQYLQSYLASGILGFISYLLILLAIGYNFILDKKYFFLFIVCIYAYFSLFESLIETHKGIVLFSILLLLVLPFDNQKVLQIDWNKRK
ncbi:O-antigen ligase family protein [Aquimarina celericrescens]|uniref:O-antigen ligase family protein n=1 Tax=Aquimarina celericrescens TaxID=1964542 RepID=A0ABW5AUR7_9FLAO|nr:O-antigen ligase family protein [Aquimarina celericrescens]